MILLSYTWFALVTLAATVVGTGIYAFCSRKEMQLTTRLGAGLGGAFIGAFAGGGLFVVASHLVGAAAFLSTTALGVMLSIAFQYKVSNHAFDWSDFL